MTIKPETQRRFCRVILEGDKKNEGVITVLLTVIGDKPVMLSDDGRFIRMHDVKRDKDHFFNTDKVIHIQLEEERDMS